MSMYNMHFHKEDGDIAARLANERFRYLLMYHAYRITQSAPGPVDDQYHQDLFQEGMLMAYRLLERDPWMYGRALVRLCVLAMYAARRRGKSVFRADPGQRLRTYEQITFDLVEVQEVDQFLDWNIISQMTDDESPAI